MKLVIGYFYPQHLNLYGDDGNVQILEYRAKKRGVDVKVVEIGLDENYESIKDSGINLLFMGGGLDSSQKEMYLDLVNTKSKFLKEYIESGGVGLLICGSYQLFGDYYKSADGSMLQGLDILDLYTESFGTKKPRCIGNILCSVNFEALNKNFSENYFKDSKFGDTLVGFENHGGRTYLGKNCKPFAFVKKGHGNNSEDKTEGCLYKNIIGSYMHGPILARNPHLADYLIATALNEKLEDLDDSLIYTAHNTKVF